MKRLLLLLAIVVVAAVAAVAVVILREPSPEARPVPTAAPIQPSDAGPSTASPTPPRVEPEVTATAGRQFGSVNVTMRQTQGTDHVACGDIQSEFAVYLDAGQGKVRWTGQVFDAVPRQYPSELSPLSGVTIEPATGLLELGQRQLVRVSGRFNGPGSRFYVVVSAPNATGAGWVSVEFTCR